MIRFPAPLIALACAASVAVTHTAHAQTSRSANAQLQHAALGVVTIAPARLTPVAAHDLARGSVLGPTDIAWSDSAVAHEAMRDTVQVGWVARRSFHAGEVLEGPGVSPPDLVNSGDAVEVIYTGPGVAITMHGTAVGTGAKGDEVYVRLDNRRRLRGVVAGANTVRVM